MEQEERDRIDKITATIHSLLKGNIPEEIDVSNYSHDEIKQLSETVNKLIESLSTVKDFIIPLSHGVLDKELDKKYFLASPFKQLQASLRHLTWQTEQIAKGDFNQRVDFMGDFSKAFNSMVVALDEARKDIIAKNRELDSFVYRISHDLKAPVVSFEGLISIILKETRGKLDQKTQYYLELIQEAAKKMEHLINDLLELSRIGRVVKFMEDVESSKIVEGAISNLRTQLIDKKIELNIAENLPVIHCDKGRIEQVFTNLINNSIKYMGNTPKPKIEIGFQDKGGDFYEFHVTDNGIGIAREDQEKIFDIFQRGDDELQAEGTGIGLSIVKRIIESHHGRIWVDSEKGKGARFNFTLPKP